MSAEAGSFVPNEEVDELRWVDVVTAGLLLTYERDQELLAAMSVDDQLESLRLTDPLVGTAKKFAIPVFEIHGAWK